MGNRAPIEEDRSLVAVAGLAEMPSLKSKTRTPEHTPGEAGAWVFIFADMCVFGALFVTYLYMRGTDPAGFAADQLELNANFGLVNTLFLLFSSLFVVFALRLLRSTTSRALAPTFVTLAWMCGFAFLVVKIVEYGEKVHRGITPQTSDFFMYYYVLTGVHALHLIVGLGILSILYWIAKRPQPTRTQVAFFEGGACFWHLVDMLWFVLFPLLYLVNG